MKKLLVMILSALLVSVASNAESATKRHDGAKTSKTAGSHKHHHKHKKITKVVRHKHVVSRRKHVEEETAPLAAKDAATSELKLSQTVSVVPARAVLPAAPMQVAVPAQAAVPAAPAAASLAPVATLSEAAPPPPAGNLDLRSAAAVVVDQATGQALYAKNPNMQTPIASITKLMTSVVVLDAKQPLDEQITITEQDVDRLKHTTSRLPVGATLSRGELLHLALIASENRAAAALARSYPGGREACIQAMNRKAAALGMASTHYVDGTGLNSANQSTAVDLAKLVNVASAYPLIHQITSTGEYGVDLPGYKVVRVRHNGKVRRVSREVERRVAFHNTNALTRNPDWQIGLSKTGFINEAGHCLVMQARIGERKVIMVLLDSAGKMTRIGDAARVRKWLESSRNET